MNRYAILLGKKPPPLKFSNTATAPMNMVVNAAGELITYRTPTLGMAVYVNATPIGFVSGFEPGSGQVTVNLEAPSATPGTYKFHYTNINNTSSVYDPSTNAITDPSTGMSL